MVHCEIPEMAIDLLVGAKFLRSTTGSTAAAVSKMFQAHRSVADRITPEISNVGTTRSRNLRGLSVFFAYSHYSRVLFGPDDL